MCRRTDNRKQGYRRRALSYGHTPVVEDFTEADVIAKYGDTCVYCPDGGFETIDHLICVRAGGNHVLDNVVPCCRSCNVKKRWTVDRQHIQALHNATGRAA